MRDYLRPAEVAQLVRRALRASYPAVVAVRHALTTTT